jgi:hypothetical protein
VIRVCAAFLLGLAIGTFVAISTAQEYTPEDTLQAIEEASANSGVPAAWLRRIVRCETGGTWNPYARGRLGERGAVQLYPRGGEWPRFFVHYSDPDNPYEAIHYLADALLAGRAGAWSCR